MNKGGAEPDKMTDWSTVNIPIKLKERITEEQVQNGDFSNAKEFILYAARKELQNQDIESMIERKLKEKTDN